MLKPNIECYHCHLFGHFQDQCPQQPQQWSGGESGARAFVAIEDEGDDMGFASSAWGFKHTRDKRARRDGRGRPETDLGARVQWEDSVLGGMTEHEVVIEEEVAMTAESVGGGGVGGGGVGSEGRKVERVIVIEEEVAMTAERRGKEGRTQQQQIQSQHHSVAPHENVPHPPVPPSFPTPAQQCPSACRRPSATQKQHSGRRQWTQRWTR